MTHTGLMRRIAIVAATLVEFSASAAYGADDGSVDSASKTQTYDILGQNPANSDIFSFDYGVPTSPALTLAGLATAKITPATTLKPFVLSLPSVFDSASTQTTAAFDFAPGWLTGSSLGVGGSQGELLNQDTYQNPKNWLSRLFFRARIGGALYRGDDGGGNAQKAKPSQLAFGLSTSLLDNSDPLLARAAGGRESAWISCLDSAKEAKALEPSPTSLASRSAAHDLLLLQYTQNPKSSFGKMTPAAQAAYLKKIETDKNVPKALSEDVNARALEPQRVQNDIVDFRKALSTIRDSETKAGNILATAAITDCKKEASDAAQHGADLQIGGGVVMSGTAGKVSNLRDPHVSLWVAGRIPLRFSTPDSDDCGKDDQRPFGQRVVSCWVVGGTAHYSGGQMLATGNSTTPTILAEIKEAWGGIERIDSSMKFGGYVGYVEQSASIPSQQALAGSGVRWLASADFSLSMISDGLWIEGSYGNASGSVSRLDDKTFMLSLSFGPPTIGSGFTNGTNKGS